MIHLLTALLLFLLGWLVRVRQWSWLIAGYNTAPKKEKDTYDVPALCRGMGNFLFLLGGILLAGALGEVLTLSWLLTFSWMLFGLATIAFLIYANTGGRFKKEGS